MSLALALTAALTAAPLEGDAVGAVEPEPPASLIVQTDLVDAQAVEAGLRARVGDALDDWRIRVRAAAPGRVHVSVVGPDGSVRERSIALEGATREDRSRELAASLALLLDQPGDPPRDKPDRPHPPPLPKPPEQPDEPSTSPPLRGWIGLGPRLGAGGGLRFEAGLDLLGGVWLLRERIQPLGSFSVSGGRAAGIALAHLRFGGGAAFGAPLRDGRLWLGGLLLVQAMWLRAEQAGVDSAWFSSTEVGGLLQYRGDRFYFGVRTGLDLTLPPASVRGRHGLVRRGVPRWLLGLNFGVVFG